MFYTALFLLENGKMEVSLGDVAYIVITLIAVGTAYGVLKGKQNELERRIATLEEMVKTQIEVDNGIKDAINQLNINLAAWQASITEQIKSLVEKVNRV